jgi:RNA-directed DNA polymerase
LKTDSPLETHLKSLGTRQHPIYTVFYADDFVIFTTTEADLHRAKTAVETWLQDIGLTLHPEKTKLSHTLTGQAGFDFLGFEIRQYLVGKYASKQGFKTLIKPSKQSQKRHREKLKTLVSHHKSVPQAALIAHLNPVILGWGQYDSTVVSKAVFAALSAYLFRILWHWAKHRHPNLNHHQIASRYWGVHQGSGWVFQTGDGFKLRSHPETSIRRHTKVKANRSPYDGDWLYWGARLRTYPMLAPRTATLLKHQNGKCSHCGLHLLLDDRIELHHLDGNHNHSSRTNLALLHRHCHDQVHATATQPTTGTLGTEPC